VLVGYSALIESPLTIKLLKGSVSVPLTVALVRMAVAAVRVGIVAVLKLTVPVELRAPPIVNVRPAGNSSDVLALFVTSSYGNPLVSANVFKVVNKSSESAAKYLIR